MTDVPRWLELQGEIDYRLFLVDKLRERAAKRSNLDLMIDLATGAMEDEAQQLMSEISALKAEYDALVT